MNNNLEQPQLKNISQPQLLLDKQSNPQSDSPNQTMLEISQSENSIVVDADSNVAMLASSQQNMILAIENIKQGELISRQSYPSAIIQTYSTNDDHQSPFTLYSNTLLKSKIATSPNAMPKKSQVPPRPPNKDKFQLGQSVSQEPSHFVTVDAERIRQKKVQRLERILQSRKSSQSQESMTIDILHPLDNLQTSKEQKPKSQFEFQEPESKQESHVQFKKSSKNDIEKIIQKQIHQEKALKVNDSRVRSTYSMESQSRNKDLTFTPQLDTKFYNSNKKKNTNPLQQMPKQKVSTSKNVNFKPQPYQKRMFDSNNPSRNSSITSLSKICSNQSISHIKLKPIHQKQASYEFITPATYHSIQSNNRIGNLSQSVIQQRQATPSQQQYPTEVRMMSSSQIETRNNLSCLSQNNSCLGLPQVEEVSQSTISYQKSPNQENTQKHKSKLKLSKLPVSYASKELPNSTKASNQQFPQVPKFQKIQSYNSHEKNKFSIISSYQASSSNYTPKGSTEKSMKFYLKSLKKEKNETLPFKSPELKKKLKLLYDSSNFTHTFKIKVKKDKAQAKFDCILNKIIQEKVQKSSILEIDAEKQYSKV